MAIVKPNVMRKSTTVTTSTADTSIFHVSDNGTTVPYKSGEIENLVLANPNTTTSVWVQLFDTDITNSSVTATGSPQVSFTIGPAEEKIFTRDQLLGCRFFYDVNARVLTTTGVLTLFASISMMER